MKKILSLEYIEPFDPNIIDEVMNFDMYEQKDDETSSVAKKIGITFGLIAISGIIAAPVTILSLKAGTIVYALATTSSLTYGFLFSK